MDGREGRTRWRGERAWPWVLGLAGIAIAFRTPIATGFAEVSFGAGDARLVHYLYEHTWHWLVQAPGHASFWDPPVHYPALGVGGYTDTVIGTAPLYWIWRALGFGATAAFQLFMMTALACNFVVGHMVLHRLLAVGALPAATGAMLLAVGSNRLANFHYAQLLPLVWVLLAWFGAARALDVSAPASRRRVGVVLAGLGLAGQGWSAWYPLFFLLLVGVLASGVGLALPEGRARLADLVRRHGVMLALVAASVGLALLPLAAGHLAAVEETGFRKWSMVEHNLPRWASWVFPGSTHAWYGGVRSWPMFQFLHGNQHAHGLGVMTLAVAVVGLWLGRHRLLVRAVAFTTLVGLVLFSEWPFGETVWRAIHTWVPGAGSIRYPGRIGSLLLIPGAVGVAVAVAALMGGKAAARGRATAAAVLVVAMMIEQVHRERLVDPGRLEGCVATIAARVDPEAEAFFVSTRSPEGAEPMSVTVHRKLQIAAMFATLRTGVPTVNGKYGNTPTGWNLLRADARDDVTSRRVHADLAQWLQRYDLDPKRIQHIELSREELPWVKRHRGPRKAARLPEFGLHRPVDSCQGGLARCDLLARHRLAERAAHLEPVALATAGIDVVPSAEAHDRRAPHLGGTVILPIRSSGTWQSTRLCGSFCLAMNFATPALFC